MSKSDVKAEVKRRYAQVASEPQCCCGGAAPGSSMSAEIGYSEDERTGVPDGADLGLGCGNPTAIASLEPGETVLDLGSGAGFDCFLAAKAVGEGGRVIGVDMTPEMLDRARANAERGGYSQVEFRHGEIESLPVDDSSVDVVISNCVINLSPEKERVFAEIARVLKPGGRFYISDLALLEPLPESVRNSAAAYSACVAGAMLKDEYLELVRAAGLADVQITREAPYPIETLTADPTVACLTEELADLPAGDIERAARAVVSLAIVGRRGDN